MVTREKEFFLVKSQPMYCKPMKSLVYADSLDAAWLIVNPLAKDLDGGCHRLIWIKPLGPHSAYTLDKSHA